MKVKRLYRVFLVLLLVAMNISCDQITKQEVRLRITENQIIEVISSNFILTKVENTGAALSLGENLPPFFKILLLQILPILILLGILGYIASRLNLPKIQVIAFSFIVGGGIGNIIDRIRFDSVTDFMYLEIGQLHTGIFNMADVSVTLGTILILINSICQTRYKRIKASL